MSEKINYSRSQIFTQPKYVMLLLSCVDYKENVFGKKFLENSCGNGAILLEVVQRYINDCNDLQFSKERIKQGLENDIYAFEIDEEHYKECIFKLNNLVFNNNIDNINWNIHNVDFLKSDINIKFDFIVGNPPYLNYRLLDKDTREYIRENFDSCKYGRYDYSYAFIEKSYKLLEANGKMSYLIPNSIFKNISAKDLRALIKPYVFRILDNFSEDVFPGINVSTSIICLKNVETNTLNYFDNTKGYNFEIDKNNLDEKWKFIMEYDSTVINKIKFGQVYNVGSTLATLLNRAFVFTPDKDDDEYYYVDDFKIEKEITKKACSPRNYNFSKIEYIIYPYDIDKDGKLIRYKEEELKNKYPFAYKYLEKNKDNLKAKDNEKGINWFEYGRSQALTNMAKEKLMMSIIITNKVKVYFLEKNDIPYSGLYITQKNVSYTLSNAKAILESDDFMKYINEIGITSSRKSKRITPNDVKNYEF